MLHALLHSSIVIIILYCLLGSLSLMYALFCNLFVVSIFFPIFQRKKCPSHNSFFQEADTHKKEFTKESREWKGLFLSVLSMFLQEINSNQFHLIHLTTNLSKGISAAFLFRLFREWAGRVFFQDFWFWRKFFHFGQYGPYLTWTLPDTWAL